MQIFCPGCLLLKSAIDTARTRGRGRFCGPRKKAAGGDGEKNKDLKNAAPAGIYYDPAKAQKLAEARRTRGEGGEPGVVPPGKRKRDKFKNKEKKKKPPRSE